MIGRSFIGFASAVGLSVAMLTAAPSVMADEDTGLASKFAAGPSIGQLAQNAWAMGCGSRYRYLGVLRRLHIPGDRRRYGTCREWGLWKGRSYAGHHNLPRGYWVWRAPYWYIYAQRGVARARTPVRGARGCVGSPWAYAGLMRRLNIPSDRRQYGHCKEWGIWKGRSYRGHHNLPRGYWVWRAPFWYIYRQRFRR